MKNNEVKLYTWTFVVNTYLMQFSITHPGPGFENCWFIMKQGEVKRLQSWTKVLGQMYSSNAF